MIWYKHNLYITVDLFSVWWMVKSKVICSELKVVFGNVSQKFEKDR